jgi:hypothetical protein
MTDTMTSQNNVVSSWDTLHIFTFEMEFTKRSATPTNVSGRIQQFAITRNYSWHGNISICVQNHWAWGGSWPYHTKHVQPVRCINIRYCNEWMVQFMGDRFICQNCIVLYHNLTFCSQCWAMPWAVWILAVAHRTLRMPNSIPYTDNCPTQCCAVRQMPAVNCQ